MGVARRSSSPAAVAPTITILRRKSSGALRSPLARLHLQRGTQHRFVAVLAVGALPAWKRSTSVRPPRREGRVPQLNVNGRTVHSMEDGRMVLALPWREGTYRQYRYEAVCCVPRCRWSGQR